jgi:hypothetical protein
VIHPVHGEVEVGGWDSKFIRQNPPPELLEEWIEKEARFNLMLAGSLPQVVMHEPEIKGKRGEFTIEIEVENEGFIPTALKQAQLVKMVRPDRITLEFPEGMLPQRSQRRGRFGGRSMEGARREQPQGQKEKPKVEILEPTGGRPYIEISRIPGNKKMKVKFKVRLNGIERTECTVKYTSTRGGVVSKDIVIGK